MREVGLSRIDSQSPCWRTYIAFMRVPGGAAGRLGWGGQVPPFSWRIVITHGLLLLLPAVWRTRTRPLPVLDTVIHAGMPPAMRSASSVVPSRERQREWGWDPSRMVVDGRLTTSLPGR